MNRVVAKKATTQSDGRGQGERSGYGARVQKMHMSPNGGLIEHHRSRPRLERSNEKKQRAFLVHCLSDDPEKIRENYGKNGLKRVYFLTNSVFPGEEIIEEDIG